MRRRATRRNEWKKKHRSFVSAAVAVQLFQLGLAWFFPGAGRKWTRLNLKERKNNFSARRENKRLRGRVATSIFLEAIKKRLAVNNYFNDDDTALQKSVWVFLFWATLAFFCWLSQNPTHARFYKESTSAKILFLSAVNEKWRLDTRHYRFGERKT